MYLKLLAPRPGLEPGTYGLTEEPIRKIILSKSKNRKRFSGRSPDPTFNPNLSRTLNPKLHAVMWKVSCKTTE